MGNPSPLVLNLRIVFLGQTIVGLVEVSIKLIEVLTGQDLTLSISFMNSLLKFRKLCLTKNRPLETVQIIIEQGKAFLVVLGFLKQGLGHDIFIGRRSNLSQEDRIISVDIGLIFSGKGRMHTVAHLMDQGVEIVQGILPVEQDKSLGIIGATRICSRAFALIGCNINPALGQGLFYSCLVIKAKDRQDF